MTALGAVPVPSEGGPEAGARQAGALLRFARDGRGDTFLSRQHTPYPFHITRPFRMDTAPSGMATLYLQSSSGGLYRGDDLTLCIEIGAEAAAHVTSQASTVVNDARGDPSRMALRFSVERGGLLEWVPDPAILLPGAALETNTRVDLADGASAILTDSFLAHCPADQSGTFAHLRWRTEVRAGGTVVLLDRGQVDGAALSALAPAGLSGLDVHGSMIALGPAFAKGEALDTVRDALAAAAAGDDGGVFAGASTLPGGCGIGLRAMAREGHRLRAALLAAWSALRHHATGSAPPPRRK